MNERTKIDVQRSAQISTLYAVVRPFKDRWGLGVVRRRRAQQFAVFARPAGSEGHGRVIGRVGLRTVEHVCLGT